MRTIFSWILMSAAIATTARTELLVSDDFTYPNGALTTGSGGVWFTHSGTPDQLTITDGKAGLTFGQSEDVSLIMGGDLYDSGSLFYGLTVNFSALPTVSGSYFAHFRDSESGGATDFLGRLWVRLSGTDQLQFGASTRSAAPVEYAATTFGLGENIRLVVQMDLDAGEARLWLNPVDLTALPDQVDTTAFSFAGDDSTLSSFALRQASGIGTMTVDDLLVGTEFVDVIPEPSTWVLVGLAMAGWLGVRFSRKRGGTAVNA